MEVELTPLTCDPVLRQKWYRVLQLEKDIKKAEDKLGEKLNELNDLRRDLGIH